MGCCLSRVIVGTVSTVSAAAGLGRPPWPPAWECSFLVRPKQPFVRPDPGVSVVSRAAAVKTGRRPPPRAARSGLDSGEHGARFGRVGEHCRAVIGNRDTPVCQMNRGELANRRQTYRAYTLVFGGLMPTRTMMQPCASAASSGAAGPFSEDGVGAMPASGHRHLGSCHRERPARRWRARCSVRA